MPAQPFRIKICGVTKAEDARAAVEAGSDAIGLNFYPESSRYLELRDAFGIHRHTLGSEVDRVGVFVNAEDTWVRERIYDVHLDAIQLHGDEPPEFLSQLPDFPIIRARRMDERGVAALAEDLAACEAAGRLPDAVLVDAMTPGRYGGTGETVSWAGLADYRKWLGDVPLILAGGLTPDNVAEAIRMVRPAGVDVASGVESSPGVKDHEKIRRFVDAARDAFDSL